MFSVALFLTINNWKQIILQRETEWIMVKLFNVIYIYIYTVYMDSLRNKNQGSEQLRAWKNVWLLIVNKSGYEIVYIYYTSSY